MAEKFPSFEYVPALAKYMLTFIDKLPSYDADRPNGFMYKVKEDVPDQVHEAFFDLPGSTEERYDILLELSDAANDYRGVEEYIEELEAPVYDGQLIDWLGAEYTSQRLVAVNEALRNGAETIQAAISEAWVEFRGSELREAAAVLEDYLNCGSSSDEEDEEEEIDTE